MAAEFWHKGGGLFAFVSQNTYDGEGRPLFSRSTDAHDGFNITQRVPTLVSVWLRVPHWYRPIQPLSPSYSSVRTSSELQHPQAGLVRAALVSQVNRLMYDRVAAVNAILVGVYLFAAIVMSIHAAFFRRRENVFHPADGRRSRTPLLAAVRKRLATDRSQRTRWWQFWRRKRAPLVDEESGLMRPPPPPRQIRRPGNAYGTFFIEHFDDFPEPANLAPEVSVGVPIPSSTVLPPPLPPRQKQTQVSNKALAPQSPRKTSSVYDAAPASRPGAFPARPSSFEQDYELVRKLNWSNDNALFLVRSRTTSQLCIIKQVQGKLRSGQFPIFPHETLMLDALREHPGMLTMVDHFCDLEVPHYPLHNIVTEFADAGDLDNLCQFYRDRDEQVPEGFVLHFAAKMLRGLAFMHYGVSSKNCLRGKRTRIKVHKAIIHRDLKPANVFLKWPSSPPSSSSALPDVIIGDFGLASYDDETNTDVCGTRPYAAPEVLAHWNDLTPSKKKIVTKESDMYGFGMILYELLALRRYSPGRKDLHEIFDSSSVRGHKEILEVLERCLATNPAERPRADKLLRYANRFERRVKKGVSMAWPSPGYADEKQNARKTVEEVARREVLWSAGGFPVSRSVVGYSLRRMTGALRPQLGNFSTGLEGYEAIVESLQAQFAGFSGRWDAAMSGAASRLKMASSMKALKSIGVGHDESGEGRQEGKR